MTIFLATTQRPVPSASNNRPVILGFGDSLTAGFGVPREGGYPDQLQRTLDQRGFRYRVVNMGISGDTIKYIPTQEAIKQRHVDLNLVAFYETLGICFGRNPDKINIKFKKQEGFIERHF